jgi:hypothetical protein
VNAAADPATHHVCIYAEYVGSLAVSEAEKINVTVSVGESD